MGRPADEPDPGRPRGQGPALPVHRRHAVAVVPRGGPEPPRTNIWARRATGSRWWLRRLLGLVPSGPLGARGLAGMARFAATHMAHRFIAGSTPDEALADRPASSAASGSPSPPTCWARRSSARPRPTLYAADLPRPAPGPGRPAGRRARDPADRPRRPRADPPRQPLAQADEPHAPVRRPARRDDDRTRPAPAPADPAHGPRAGRLSSTSTWSSTPTRT